MGTSNSNVNINMKVNGVNAGIASIKSLTGAFGGLTGILSTLGVSLSVASFTHMITGAIQSADAMGKLAEKTGIGVEALSGLSFAAKLADVSQEQLQTGIKKLSVEMAANGRGAEDVYKELLRVSDLFADMPDGANKTALAVTKFGKAGQDLIPFLNQGSKAIQEQIDKAHRLGLTIGPEFATNADQFGDNVDELKARVQGMFLRLAEKILPSLNESMAKFFSFIDKNHLDTKGVAALADIFDRLKISAKFLAEFPDKFLTLAKNPLFMLMAGSAPSLMVSHFTPNIGSNSPVDDRTEEQKNAGRMDAGFHSPADGAGVKETRAALEQRVQFHVKAFDDIRRLEADLAKTQQENIRNTVQVTSQMFGNLASTAAIFGKKGFETMKAFATAQAIIDTFGAANAAYVSAARIPYIGFALAPVAAAAAAAAGLANVYAIQSQQPPSYEVGGYTGNAGTSTPAGIVHGREYVLNAATTQRFGTGALDAMQSGGDMPTLEGQSFAFFDDRTKMEAWLRSRQGKKVIIDIVGGAKHEFMG